MHKRRDMLWTWLIADGGRRGDGEEWVRHGGKWIIFDRKERIEELAARIAPLVDSGGVAGAKYWNEDPSAICVYCLDSERAEIEKVLDSFGAGKSRVWEYDYAIDKNIKDTATFIYSWYSKFRTILQSYGIMGSMKLLREILRGGGRK